MARQPLITGLKYLARSALAADREFKDRYQAFGSLLEHDRQAHELMAEVEDHYYRRLPLDINRLERLYSRLAEHVSGLVRDLTRIDPFNHRDLPQYFEILNNFSRFILKPPVIDLAPPYVLDLAEINPGQADLVGGKADRLAELGRELNLPIPPGLVITSRAFNLWLDRAGLRARIDDLLAGLDLADRAALERVSAEITDRLDRAPLPGEVSVEINARLAKFGDRVGRPLSLAVRSSAVAEDGRASFAGQYQTVLGVAEADILAAYRQVAASKYSPNAIFYRINYGLADAETPMAVLVLPLIAARAAGVAYSRDLERPQGDRLIINAVHGLGELLVSGKTGPDRIWISKTDPPHIIERLPGDQTEALVLAEDGQTKTVPWEDKSRPSLTDDQALTLARWAMDMEAHYGHSLDIEWAVDHDDQPVLLQARPLHAEKAAGPRPTCDFSQFADRLILDIGQAASVGIDAGPVVHLDGDRGEADPPPGAVLVARNSLPRYAHLIHRAAALITETGSPAGHLASVAREYGVPTIVGAVGAMKRLEPGQTVTVFGDQAQVYRDRIEALTTSPCAERNLQVDSELEHKLRYLVNFISPLGLTDPESDRFTAGGVRSLHDIIRFTHERAVQAMFKIGDRKIKTKRGAKKLDLGIPMLIYLLDVGGGLIETAQDRGVVSREDIASLPLRAVIRGLMHPDIRWGQFSHFNWAEYDKIVMNGGIISAESAQLASYVIAAADYVNLNLKFGYHFVILDALLTGEGTSNQILFRFSGGGDSLDKRSLRARFVELILVRLGFDVEAKSDLVDARLTGRGREEIETTLDQMGRLLGATRLMDMYLDEDDPIDELVEDFMTGRYDFSTEGRHGRISR